MESFFDPNVINAICSFAEFGRYKTKDNINFKMLVKYNGKTFELKWNREKFNSFKIKFINNKYFNFYHSLASNVMYKNDFKVLDFANRADLILLHNYLMLIVDGKLSELNTELYSHHKLMYEQELPTVDGYESYLEKTKPTKISDLIALFTIISSCLIVIGLAFFRFGIMGGVIALFTTCFFLIGVWSL